MWNGQRKARELVKKYKHFLLLSFYGILQFWYFYCEKVVTRPKYVMFSRIDSYIPFVKEFVIPYLLWFVYMAVALVYLGLVSKEDYYRLCAFMFGGMSVCYTIYLIFPNGQYLRPEIVGKDIFSRMIQHIYATDTPTNVAPSIHVFNSIAVHIALSKCKAVQKTQWIKPLSFILMLLISASTVFIKQHSIEDVLWAIVLAALFYVVIYHFSGWISMRYISGKKGNGTRVSLQ